jgi:hypothetical protein
VKAAPSRGGPLLENFVVQVLYSGEQLISFGDRLWAVPLGVLWAT